MSIIYFIHIGLCTNSIYVIIISKGEIYDE